MFHLRRFKLFPKLPYDIRVMIWKLCFVPRMVYLKEELFDEDNEEDDPHLDGDSAIHFDETDSEQTTRTDRERQIALYDVIVTHPQHTGFQKRQKQLEDFGFSSTQSAPKLRRVSWDAMDDESRKGFLYSSAKFTVLLHACKESRELLKHLGYDLAFGTRMAPPRTWFNFECDFLLLHWCYIGPISATIDGGYWNIGQILPCDLRRVQKLALICPEHTWEEHQSTLLTGVKMFGNLKELVLVTHRNSGRIYLQHVGNEYKVRVTLHQCLCHQSCRQHFFKVREHLNRTNGEELPRGVKSEALTKMLRMNRDEEVAAGRPSWSVPKLRIRPADDEWGSYDETF